MDPQYVHQVFIDRTAPPAPVLTMTEVKMAVKKMAYVAYIVYDEFLRPIDPEEVCLILSQMHELYADPRSFQDMFRKCTPTLGPSRGCLASSTSPTIPSPNSTQSVSEIIQWSYSPVKTMLIVSS